MKRSNDLFPTFFDDFFGRDWFANELQNRSTLPSVNIKESEDAYAVEMAAPGMDKKDFKVELDNNTLTISYEKEESNESKPEEGRYTKREFNYQSFSRSFNLPNTVEADKIEAKYKEGILTLSIPKKEEAKQKPSRLISIR
ncbi:Hsp20/alpha crystallin family protein [Fulvivirga aurantia]|uniref:Hsp20/alpha crystallin family protein n=1 Tax=Fulvivirga aurantia TaxID=2529383 RepID=UPI0031B5A83B